ncbi:MAG TPA: helix-turn-helix transcriptional regulator, partial [Anaerolineae bacterium]|nr:helix-turn-helix transcriptional regulator [Anaerolineae bacterium]
MSTLLSTKLHAPRPHRALVHRQRLLDCLDAGLRSQGGTQESLSLLGSRFARKLTLVSAPAGYGKTTLVSDWIARSQAPAAWLSLDASDNDPPRFFSYVIAGLQQIDPEIGIDIRPILETGADLAIEPVLAALVNDIALSASAPSNRIALVLDDYHEIQDIRIHQGLDFLLDHMPPGMHMVIISRADPPMPLGRLRVQRELTEIREADLRFTLEEATTFLNELMGLALPAEDIESLDARTEGWVAGLQLAALSLQGRSDKRAVIATFSGSHRHLIDYLIHEVMSRQPERVRTFLLRSSILERFTASLCDVLTGETDGQEMLLALEASDLFLIPLDDERQWYRYH